jgi:hypothetical protein
VPESRRRKKPPKYLPEGAATEGESGPSGRWLPITFVTLMVVGLVWLILFYVAGSSIPLISDLGNWNIAVGMGLIVGGFILMTRWE